MPTACTARVTIDTSHSVVIAANVSWYKSCSNVDIFTTLSKPSCWILELLA